MSWWGQYEGMTDGINPAVCAPSPQGCGCCWGAQDCHPAAWLGAQEIPASGGAQVAWWLFYMAGLVMSGSLDKQFTAATCI